MTATLLATAGILVALAVTALPPRYTVAAAFVATVVATNWALGRYGIVPVGLGMEAPAGVYAAGIAFGLRDLLHELGGRRWVLGAIAVGAAVSYFIEDAATIPGGLAPIAVASAAAFTVSELADLVVYSPLRGRSWPAAVTLSNIVGAVIDSALFLWLAFGGLDHMAGQVWGKALMVVPAVAVIGGARVLSRHTIRAQGA